MEEKIHIMQDMFKNGNTGEEVPGVTVIVDGAVRQMFDVLIKRSSQSNNYVEIMHEILLAGVEHLMQNGRK